MEGRIEPRHILESDLRQHLQRALLRRKRQRIHDLNGTHQNERLAEQEKVHFTLAIRSLISAGTPRRA